jgi:hypothetical protein
LEEQEGIVQQPELVESACVHQLPNQIKEFGQALRMGDTRHVIVHTIRNSDQLDESIEN